MNTPNETNEKKRYSIFTTPIKNDFYAIRHPHHTPNDQENQPNINHTALNELKRTAIDDITSSPSSAIDGFKRMKIQPQNIKINEARSQEQQQLQLFNTCKSLWPENQTLGDLSHDKIMELSNLLKIRLLQGKFKLMDNMDPNNELYRLFTQDRVLPTKLKHSHKIALSSKRTKSVLSVVGNRRNLPTGNNNIYTSYEEPIASPLPSIDHDALLVSPIRPQHLPRKKDKTPKNNQKINRTPGKSPRTPMKSPRMATKSPRTPAKTPRTPITPRRKGTTPDAPTVILPDGKQKRMDKSYINLTLYILGKRFFLCEPCNKKYKNRNGLTYHLVRCKNNGPFNNREEDELQSQQSVQSAQSVTSAQSQNTINAATPLNEITPMNETTPTAIIFEENKEEPLLEEFDLFDSINSSFDEDMLSSLQSSNIGFSPQMDDLYNLL
jgi:hypothetical protein